MNDYFWFDALKHSIRKNKRLRENRYFQLVTISEDTLPANRTVVFRGFTEPPNSIKVITDSRSKKLEELKEFAKEMIVKQMANYGQAGLPDEELEGVVARIMSNQDEARKLSEQLMSKKLLEFYKSNLLLKKKKLTFDAFVKEAYGQG